MVTALLAETKITLPVAAKLFPGEGGREHINHSTLWRWALKGCRAMDGRLVKLEAFRAGCRWYTTQEAVTRFVEALSSSLTEEQTRPPTPRTPTARRKASDRAAAELEKAGI